MLVLLTTVFLSWASNKSLKIFNREAMREEEVFLCSLCPLTFHSKTAIIKHMLNIHNNEPTIQKLESQRNKHKISNKRKARYLRNGSQGSTANPQHTIKKIRVYTKEYHCDVCPYKTVHLTTFNRHKLTHDKDGRKHQCAYCSFSTIQAYNLERHINDIHPFGPVEPVILVAV